MLFMCAVNRNLVFTILTGQGLKMLNFSTGNIVIHLSVSREGIPILPVKLTHLNSPG